MPPTKLDWLTARPIAHRGLHDAARGIIENTAAAVRAAIEGGYGIEVDLQISADGEAMVHHDDVLGRLTDGAGRLDRLSAAELKRVAFRGSAERMMTLGDLCDLVGGRAALLLELKSRFDGDGRLPARVAASLAGYRGPVAPMSFDPLQLQAAAAKGPSPAARHCGGKIPAASLLGSDAAMAALRHGQLAARLDGAAAVRGLCIRRFAGVRAALGAAHFVPAARDMGGTDGGRAATRRPLGRPDDFRGLSAMNHAENEQPGLQERSARDGGRAARRRGECDRARSAPRRGTPAPIRRPTARPAVRSRSLHRQIRKPYSTHSYRTIFFRPWRPRNRSAAVPAGRSSTCSSKQPTAPFLPPRRATSRAHSRGEYVFDAGWAEAYMRAGGSYYPKLQVAVPFTPATGRRLLVRPGPQAGEARRRAASPA